MDGVFVRRVLDVPLPRFLQRAFVLSAPQVDLGNTVADSFLRIKWSAPLKQRTSMLEQADMRIDRAQPAIGVRKILVQRERPLQLRDGLDMLEVFRRSPQQECLGYV